MTIHIGWFGGLLIAFVFVCWINHELCKIIDGYKVVVADYSKALTEWQELAKGWFE